MCDNDEFKRMIIKQGSGAATIPTSADHRNGDWLETDIYEGEWYQDVVTGNLYTRSAAGIIGWSGTSIPLTVILDVTQVQSMNATPQVVFSPPSTYGARFSRLPVVDVDPDGVSFVFASGETMQIQNAQTIFTGNHLGLWGDPTITNAGVWVPQPPFQGHEVVAGDLTVTSSIPITGGGTNATMTFYLEIELFKL